MNGIPNIGQEMKMMWYFFALFLQGFHVL